mgnify:CR=1 FL=1
MAIPNAVSTVENQIEAIMNNTLDQSDRHEILLIHARDSIDDAIGDIFPIFGSARMVHYDPGTITSSEKITIGADHIAVDFYAGYVRSDSGVLHDGTGKIVFSQGDIWHFPTIADFEDFVDCVHLRCTYRYIDDNGSGAETTIALNNYDNAINALT